jgi:hypothetical protein
MGGSVFSAQAVRLSLSGGAINMLRTAIVVGSVLAALGAAVPASAAVIDGGVAPRSSCAGDRVCDWDEADFQASNTYGSEESLPVSPGYCLNSLITDGYRSIINTSGMAERAWSGSNCTGRFTLIPANNSASDLGYQAFSLGGN